MQTVGLSLMAFGVFGLLVLASHIAWQEIQSLRYLRDLDDWASEVPPWQ